jgi:hypothetical protein
MRGKSWFPALPGYLGVSIDHDEIAPGWLHAMRLTVAASELRSGWSEAAKQRPMVEVPMSSGFEAVVIDVLLGTSTPALIRLDRAFLVANMGRGDGGTAVIVARPTRLDAPVHEALAPEIAEAVDELRRSAGMAHPPRDSSSLAAIPMATCARSRLPWMLTPTSECRSATDTVTYRSVASSATSGLGDHKISTRWRRSTPGRYSVTEGVDPTVTQGVAVDPAELQAHRGHGASRLARSPRHPSRPSLAGSPPSAVLPAR